MTEKIFLNIFLKQKKTQNNKIGNFDLVKM